MALTELAKQWLDAFNTGNAGAAVLEHTNLASQYNFELVTQSDGTLGFQIKGVPSTFEAVNADSPEYLKAFANHLSVVSGQPELPFQNTRSTFENADLQQLIDGSNAFQTLFRIWVDNSQNEGVESIIARTSAKAQEAAVVAPAQEEVAAQAEVTTTEESVAADTTEVISENPTKAAVREALALGLSPDAIKNFATADGRNRQATFDSVTDPQHKQALAKIQQTIQANQNADSVGVFVDDIVSERNQALENYYLFEQVSQKGIQQVLDTNTALRNQMWPEVYETLKGAALSEQQQSILAAYQPDSGISILEAVGSVRGLSASDLELINRYTTIENAIRTIPLINTSLSSESIITNLQGFYTEDSLVPSYDEYKSQRDALNTFTPNGIITNPLQSFVEHMADVAAQTEGSRISSISRELFSIGISPSIPDTDLKFIEYFNAVSQGSKYHSGLNSIDPVIQQLDNPTLKLILGLTPENASALAQAVKDDNFLQHLRENQNIYQPLFDTDNNYAGSEAFDAFCSTLAQFADNTPDFANAWSAIQHRAATGLLFGTYDLEKIASIRDAINNNSDIPLSWEDLKNNPNLTRTLLDSELFFNDSTSDKRLAVESLLRDNVQSFQAFSFADAASYPYANINIKDFGNLINSYSYQNGVIATGLGDNITINQASEEHQVALRQLANSITSARGESLPYPDGELTLGQFASLQKIQAIANPANSWFGIQMANQQLDASVPESRWSAVAEILLSTNTYKEAGLVDMNDFDPDHNPLTANTNLAARRNVTGQGIEIFR